MANAMDGLQAEVTSRACPLEIEGTIDGAFRFRAQGQHWTMSIGGNPVGSPLWQMGEPFRFPRTAAR
jgi:hypothetical protein